MLDGKAACMGLGSCNDISLDEAREAAYECRRLVKERKDPRKARAQKAVDERPKPVFGQFSKDWIDRKRGSCTDSHIARCERTLRLHAYPVKLADGRKLEDLPVNEVDTSAVIAALDPIWRLKITTAQDTRLLIELILDAAKALGHRTGDNPARWRGHLATYFPKSRSIRRTKHHASA